ncbi:hypothetical protein [Photobacterium kasasachensis]|uniref:hypothetical protein n=1 Tax=Photobacterium kasasachensis TaxID=2910240 RepID=UPI003D0A1D53
MKIYEIILEYLKVLVWPLVLILAFVFHGERLFNILENREVQAFGITIGKAIEKVTQDTHEQIRLLQEDIASQSGSEELLNRVQSLDENLNKQLSQLKVNKVLERASINGTSRLEKVERLERAGFEALLKRDVEGAIKQFSSAERLWPEFHNVSEIKRLLVEKKSHLIETDNDSAWNATIRTILEKYSWGMPSDIRALLNESFA